MNEFDERSIRNETRCKKMGMHYTAIVLSDRSLIIIDPCQKLEDVFLFNLKELLPCQKGLKIVFHVTCNFPSN